MPYPKQFGLPCWAPDQVRKVISLTAQTNADSAPYFLASHSPFERIIDAKSNGRRLAEEQVFNEIFSKARGQVQAFVKGEPGTGKSHLIRWLKLRADYAKQTQEDGFENFVFVLVSRGNGSLKDALGQIVAQLGLKFEKHLIRVRGAIDKLSNHAALDTLINSLALEVGPNWVVRHPETPFPRSLLQLPSALGANTGFGMWMKRDGGVLHQIIKRLTEESSAEDREKFPEFSEQDFLIPDQDRRNVLNPSRTPLDVIHFAEDLEEDEELRVKVAEILNLALVGAMRGLTGLGGADLLDIFSEIRHELGGDKQLAIFIEDVSVTGIDQEIINAFEPRDLGSEGCRMIAVLGITNNAWNSPRFPDNQRQRASFVFEVGGEVAHEWSENSDAVNRFAARYLNSVRLEDESLRELAKDRFSGDLNRSACEKCPYQSQCFESFGFSEFANEVRVGLFPLNRNAPKRLLKSLSDTYYQSQRGLLDHVLLPCLDKSYGTFERHEFPQRNQFSVQPYNLSFDWTAFSQRFLGGPNWGERERSRARFLAEFWSTATSRDDAAAQLGIIRDALNLPEFSEVVVSPVRCKLCGHTPCICATECQTCRRNPCECVIDPPELILLRRAVEEWSNGEKLARDAEFRKLVSEFICNSIQWQHERSTPITVSRTGRSRLIDGYAFVNIEGQTARPASQKYFLNLGRSNETKELLLALINLKYRGQNWNFEHGELHKRKLSRWLRNNLKNVVESLLPVPSSLVESARKCAIQTLALTAMLRDRRSLPTEPVERLKSVFRLVWGSENRPVVMSKSLDDILSDLEAKHASIREFVIKEFGAGQGDSAPKTFIDPTPILAILEGFAEAPLVESPPNEIGNSYWESRFEAVSKLGAYRDFSERLNAEKSAISATVERIRDFTVASGFAQQDIREALKASLKELNDLVVLQRGTSRSRAKQDIQREQQSTEGAEVGVQPTSGEAGQVVNTRGILPIPNDEFDALWATGTIQTTRERDSWASNVSNAERVSRADGFVSLLTFDPSKFKECAIALRVVRGFLEKVESQLHNEIPDGGNCDSRNQLLQVLGEIMRVTESSSGM